MTEAELRATLANRLGADHVSVDGGTPRFARPMLANVARLLGVLESSLAGDYDAPGRQAWSESCFFLGQLCELAIVLDDEAVDAADEERSVERDAAKGSG